MEKINQEQFNQLLFAGKRTPTGWFSQLISLKPGEGIILRKEEWKRKSSPLSTASHIKRKYGWKFKGGKLADGTGWAVMRVG